MPVTFPAHQGFIVGAKLAAPKWFDGTALCIAAATPDLAYGVNNWLAVRSHTGVGFLVWAVPLALLSTILVRWRAADGIFGILPDLGPLQLHSYRVLGTKSPNIAVTVVSALLGSASHIGFDAFTHDNRWGSNLLGLNTPLFTDPFGREFTAARILQYLGHTGGSLVFVAAVILISRTNRLQKWYGTDAVATARSASLSPVARATFGAAILLGIVAAVPLALIAGGNLLFHSITAVYVVTIAVGTLFGSDQPWQLSTQNSQSENSYSK